MERDGWWVMKPAFWSMFCYEIEGWGEEKSRVRKSRPCHLEFVIGIHFSDLISNYLKCYPLFFPLCPAGIPSRYLLLQLNWCPVLGRSVLVLFVVVVLVFILLCINISVWEVSIAGPSSHSLPSSGHRWPSVYYTVSVPQHSFQSFPRMSHSAHISPVPLCVACLSNWSPWHGHQSNYFKFTCSYSRALPCLGLAPLLALSLQMVRFCTFYWNLDMWSQVKGTR